MENAKYVPQNSLADIYNFYHTLNIDRNFFILSFDCHKSWHSTCLLTLKPQVDLRVEKLMNGAIITWL